jgi:hypothetical protein
MTTRCLPLFFAAVLLSAGCRNDPYMTAVFESMNAEKRSLEDRIYELQDETEMLDDQLASTRRENTKLRKQLGGSSGAEEETDTSRPRRSAIPRSILPGRNGGVEPKAPEIDLGTPGAPEGPARPGPRLEMNGPGQRGGPSELPPPAEEGAAAIPEPEDQRVTHIVLNPFLTGGHDFDHKPGDDGVAVFIEPRNADDQFITQPGPVSIVVLDPTKEGPEGRIARWDFDAHEARERLKKGRFGKGIQLKLPWPNDPPESNKLHLFVRYETEDGRKLEADREVNIALQGQYSQRWTPRPDTPLPHGASGLGTSALVGHTEELSSGSRGTSVLKPSGAKKSSTTGPSGSAIRRPTWQPNR